MQKVIIWNFLTNHVTSESACKNYYITLFSINMKANKTALKQTHKFVNKNLKNSCNKGDVNFPCFGTWFPRLPWCFEPTRELGAGAFIWSKQFVWHVCNPNIWKGLWKDSWSFTERDFPPDKIPHKQRNEDNSETIKYTLRTQK